MVSKNEFTILVINDVPDQLELMTLVLRQAGYLVVTAFDGQEGLEIARRQMPDLIISDVSMPGMDGIELCRRIRADEMLRTLPIMLVTALRKDTQSVLEGFEAGADDYMEAPYEPMRLIAKASRLIERKQIEEVQRERERYYRTLIENASDLISILNADGSMQYHSPSLGQILGYGSENLVSKNVFDFIHPEDTAEAQRSFDESLRSPASPVEVELRFRHQNGSWRYLICKLTNLLDDPSILGIVSNAYDITKQKRSEEVFRAQKDFQHSLLRSFPKGSVSVFDRDFRYLLAEGMELDRIGLSSQQLVGKTLAELFPRNEVDLALPFFERAFAGEEVEFELLAAGQTYCINAAPLRNWNSHVHAIVAVSQNITKRKREEEERVRLGARLEAQSQRLNNIVASVPGFVWEAWGKPDSSAQQMDFVSGYVEIMLGYTIKEWLSIPNFWLSIVHPEDHARMTRVSAEHFAAGRDFAEEFRWIAKDGRVVWVAAQIVLIRDDGGQPIGLRGINIDITERRLAEAKLLQVAAIVENSSDAIISKNLDGVILSWNQGAERIFGYTLEEAVGQPVTILIPEGHADEEPTILARLRNGERIEHYETVRARKDGTLVDIELTVSPLKGPDGTIIGASKIARDISDRIQAEAAIQESRAWLEAIFDASRDGIVVEENDRIVYANNALVNLYGYGSRAEVIGEPVSHFRASNDDERMHDFTRQRVTGESAPTIYEFKGVRKDSSLFDVEVSVSSFQSGGGKTSIVSMIRDITLRKRAEAARERLAAILESTTDLVSISDPAGRLVYLNRAGRQMLGVDMHEDITQLEIADFLPNPASHPVLTEGLSIAARLGSWSSEVALLSRSGREIPVSQVILAHKTPDGEIESFSTIMRDITEHQQREEELRESEERFQLLARATNEVVWDWNIVTKGVWWNEGIRTVFGYAPNEVGDDLEWWMKGIHPDDAQAIGTGIHEFLESDSPIWKAEYRYAKADGSYAMVMDSGTVIRDNDGKPVRMIGSMRDVTELKSGEEKLRQIEDQLRQSQKLESVGTLAGGIAHDFNNLLTVITGYSELALGRLDKVDPLAQNLVEIRKAAERAASLTRQLLAFSRKQVLQPKILDLNSVVANLEKMLGRLIGEDMELRTSPASQLGQVKADHGQIEQVLINLVINARDAMPKGGKITLETANIYLDEAYAHHHIAVQPGWYAMLAVTDNGHGMDAETLRHIFEPFFTTKGHGKGTGLGLSTVYGIVKQSGGNLWVYSEVGMGTTFKIYLPLVEGEVKEPHVIAAWPQSSAGTETILLAEDEKMVRDLARAVLKRHGYTVLDAANAGEALLICQQYEGPIHLLLTDVVMPLMSGKELAEQLVRMRPEMAILYMSGYTNDAIIRHGVLDGEVAFIEKPFTPDALALKVRTELDKSPSNLSPEKEDSQPPAASKEGVITYRLNERDEIVSVTEEWTRFALANDAPDLLPEKVLNRSLWDFIADPTTEHLYRQILERVRGGQVVVFPFRCDASERQRFMEMYVTSLGGGCIQFETRTLQTVERAPQKLLDRKIARGDDLIRICGWCKRVDVGGLWKEVEKAVSLLRLSERSNLPQLAHGICDTCYAEFAAMPTNNEQHLLSV